MIDCYKFQGTTHLYIKYFKHKELPQILDQLDKQYQIFTRVESLSLDTEYCVEFSDNFSKFEKLSKLVVEGHGWDTTFVNLPFSLVSFEIISMDSTVEIIKGMNKLTSLQELILPTCPFGFECIHKNPEDMNLDYALYDPKEIIPIPNLGALKTIEFYHGFPFDNDVIKDDAKISIENHPLMVNIKYRIADIKIISNPLNIVISLLPTKITKDNIRKYPSYVKSKIAHTFWLLNQCCSFDKNKTYKEYLPPMVAFDLLFHQIF